MLRRVALREDVDSTLFAVGDPDQAIYGFSGAIPELLVNLAAEPRIHKVSLERNYRCAQRIIEVSLRALGESREVTGHRGGGSVTVHAVTGGEDGQAKRALDLVDDAARHGVPHDQIAVISPWGSDRDRCADLMRAADIPVFARSDKHWRTTSLTMLLEAMASWASRRDGGGADLPELLETFSALVRGGADHSVLRSVTGVLLRGEESASARQFVEEISDAALGAYVDDPLASEDARELRRMRRALQNGADLGQMTLGELGARARAPGHVMATTVHAAKGLEFDVVVMVGVDEGGLPGFSANAEETLEGRRKFYVSITRARDQVHLIHTDCRVSGRGKTYWVRPSPFIAELDL